MQVICLELFEQLLQLFAGTEMPETVAATRQEHRQKQGFRKGSERLYGACKLVQGLGLSNSRKQTFNTSHHFEIPRPMKSLQHAMKQASSRLELIQAHTD